MITYRVLIRRETMPTNKIQLVADLVNEAILHIDAEQGRAATIEFFADVARHLAEGRFNAR